MADELRLRSLGKNVLATLAVRVAAIGFAVVQSVLLARWLRAGGLGEYQLALLVPTTLAVLLNAGISAANVYFVGRGAVSIRSALRFTLAIWGCLSVIGVSAALIVLSNWCSTLLPQVTPGLVLGAIGLLPILLLKTFLAGLLQARQDFRFFNLTYAVSPLVVVLGASALVVAWDLGVAGALIAFGLGEAAGLSVAAAALLRHWRRSVEPAEPLPRYATRALQYGATAHLGNLIQFLNLRADMYLVNLFLGVEALGVYAITVLVAEQVGVLSDVVGAVLFPRLAELHGRDDARRQLTPLVARWLFFLSFLAALAIALAGQYLIAIMFGEEYAGAFDALLYLLPGTVVLAGATALSSDIAARGRPGLNTLAALLGLIVNLAANWVLIPALGIRGAALASTISYGTIAVCEVYLHYLFTGNPWWAPLVLTRDDLRLASSFWSSCWGRLRRTPRGGLDVVLSPPVAVSGEPDSGMDGPE